MGNGGEETIQPIPSSGQKKSHSKKIKKHPSRTLTRNAIETNKANLFIGGQQDAIPSLAPRMEPQRQVEVSTVEMLSTQDCGVLGHCEMTQLVLQPCIARPCILLGRTLQNSKRNHKNLLQRQATHHEEGEFPKTML